MDRSLWPSFWRTTAAVRGSEPCNEAPSEPRVERPRNQSRERSRPKACGSERFSASQTKRPKARGNERFPLAAGTALPRGVRIARRHGWTAHSGHRSGERRLPFAALNHATKRLQSRERSDRSQSRERSRPKACGSERFSASQTKQAEGPRKRAQQRCFPRTNRGTTLTGMRRACDAAPDQDSGECPEIHIRRPVPVACRTADADGCGCAHQGDLQPLGRDRMRRHRGRHGERGQRMAGGERGASGIERALRALGIRPFSPCHPP